MSGEEIRLCDLRARVKAIEGANMLTIKPLAMQAMGDMLTFMQQQQERIEKLEGGNTACQKGN